MTLPSIPFSEFNSNIFTLFDKQWFLLTGGDFASGQFNTMTISWGTMGILWNKPIAQVVVRPVRHTFQFMEKYDTFTLSALPAKYRKALSLLGARSGRDGNKIAEAGLTPIASSCVAAPTFAEAELVLETRKIYWADLEPSHFLDASIDTNYPKKDYHRSYIGEVLAIFGEDHFRVHSGKR
jgi:flavin reductase (DIM6/NTAB) family NADH-FMN oxidoreductase RutF